MGFSRIGHSIAGLLTALATLVSGILAVLSFLVFLVYEMDQDWRKGDYMDEEFMEFGVGFSLGIVILLILKALGIVM